MSATFTEDDLEKRVENANGEVIGTVTEIESEIAHVEPRSGVVDSIRSALGWGRSSEETVSIHAESVEEITVDTIRLEADSTVEVDEEPEEPTAAGPSTDTATADTATDLEADSLDEPPATASSGSEIDESAGGRAGSGVETGPETETEVGPETETSFETGTETEMGTETETTVDESGPEDEIDDADRGIATDESERGIATDDPAHGIGTEEPPRDAAAPSESVPPERRPESDETTTHDPDDRQDAFEEGSRERGETETEAMSRTTGSRAGADTEDEAGTIEATDRIDRATDEMEAGEFGDGDDDTEMGAEPGVDTDTDADITEAASDETDTMETMNAAKGPGAIGNSEVGDSEIDDSSETMDADRSDAADVEHSDAADAEHSDAADHDEDIEHREADSSIEPNPRTVANDVSEPTDLDATEGIRNEDETDIADAFSTGVDPDSLEDVGGSDEGDDRSEPEAAGTETDATGTEKRDLTDAVDQGVDIESAAETGSDASSGVEGTNTEAMDLTDEVDTGIDAASAVESDRDAGMSTESGAETGAESGAGIDIETLPGQQVDAETGPEAGARRAMSDASVSADDIDRRAVEDDQTRDQADTRDSQTAESAVEAAFATQRAAMKSGQEAVKLGLATQQNAARAALEGTLLVQRGSLEVAETATRQYVNAIGAMMEMGTGTTRSRDTQRTGADALSQTGALTIPDIEELQSQVDDDQLARNLETHRERVRELRATVDDAIEDEQPTDRLVDLLERQADLLERCQQHLEGESPPN